MPVEFDEYRAERTEGGNIPIDPNSNAFRVLSFLSEHPDLGFKPSEIREHVDVPKGSLNPTLARLEEREFVEHESPYWSAGADDRLGAVAGTMYTMQAFENRFGDDDFEDWHETDVDPRANR